MDQYLQYIFGDNNIVFQVLLYFLGVNYLLQLFLAIYRKKNILSVCNSCFFEEIGDFFSYCGCPSNGSSDWG
ncbi:hypothetical protein MAQA_15161 [Listeria aquatica FSL S10-1188]|uniref:Uncharacterized protein n=1 Tax=Listeria aquatica FSL S10-1188 TaxID=1265818 RepID=W7ANB4_9LIST|nr:hypothetical protein MAQA_15161 [Listeria aquatica FSL S10-1188]